jgi:putative glutamine amidotransferase
MTRKPLVALVADRKQLGLHPFHCAGEKYIDAVIGGADCFAMVLPAMGNRQSLEQLLATVDGVLLTGSVSMVAPHHYGGPDLPEGQQLDVDRDATTLPLIREAVARGLPLFAICRGFQEMNVAFGGTLHQKVHEVPGMQDHREDSSATLDVQYGPAHPVRLTTGGLLQRLIGADEYMVNSIHNQGVSKLGDGLVAEAIAPDGLVEAFTVAQAKGFTLATQWHPEWQYWNNPLSTAMFKAFGDACRQYLAARQASA